MLIERSKKESYAQHNETFGTLSKRFTLIYLAQVCNDFLFILLALLVFCVNKKFKSSRTVHVIIILKASFHFTFSRFTEFVQFRPSYQSHIKWLLCTKSAIL